MASELKGLQQTLASVVDQTKQISRSLAGDLERQLLSRISVFENDVQARIKESAAALSPMVDLLSQLGGFGGAARVRRGPGRPRGAGAGASAATPGPRRRRRGRRGVRVTLTREQLEQAMTEANQVKTRAAGILGVSVPTFNKKLAEVGLTEAAPAEGKRAGRPRGRPGRKAKKK